MAKKVNANKPSPSSQLSGSTDVSVAATEPANGNKKIVRQKLADLRPHPKQASLFGDMPTAQLKDLAENIRENGLDHPAEILPDGTIVCGHQRVQAALLLGWTEIDCWVRHDLAEKGEAAILRRMLDDNRHRKQLTKLGLARCYKEERELAHKEWRAGRRPDRGEWEGDLRDALGKKLGVSGRTLDRMVRILEAPVSVQNAYEAGTLPLVLAEWVGRQETPDLQQIDKEIAEGGDPKEVVLKFQEQRNPKVLKSIEHRIYEQVAKTVMLIEQERAKINRFNPRQNAVLQRAVALIGELTSNGK